MDFCARVQTEAGRRFRKTRLCERFLRGEEIYWGSRVVVRGPGRVSFDAILLYLHIYTLHEKQPNAFQNRFLDDFITSSVVSAPPRRKLFFDALHIYIYRERERLPRLLRASLILLSSSSSSSFHRSRARRFVDGLRRAPIVVVVWHFNPKVFDDCIDFPFEFFRALNLALIASLLLSAFQRG